MDQLARDSIGRRPDAGDAAEGVGFDERSDWPIDPKHRFGRTPVTERALRIAGQERQVVQEPRECQIEV